MSYEQQRDFDRASGADEQERESRAGLAKVYEPCPMHPEGGDHECMPKERRCAYCGNTLAPCTCNGCGVFLTIKRLHEASTSDGIFRCEECHP